MGHRGRYELDPLEGLEDHPLQTQVAVLANELRNQSNRTAAVERALRSVQVALWGLVVMLLGVGVTLLATILTNRGG